MARVRERGVPWGQKGPLTFLGERKIPLVQKFFCSNPFRERCYDHLHRGPPYLSGGALIVKKVAYENKLSSRHAGLVRSGVDYYGSHVCAATAGAKINTPSYLADTVQSTMDALGTKGWAKYRPGNPVAHAGQFLVEAVRDLPIIPGLGLARSLGALPAKRKSQLSGFQQSGSEYLNIEFGWKPFVHDLQDMYNLYKNLDRHLRQLRRDNGKGIRREGAVPGAIESSQPPVVTDVFCVYPGHGSPAYPSKGQRTITETWQDKAWFAAKFRYFIEEPMSSRWTRRATAALFGVNPTPSLLWEVLPWSWLIDWFVNAGDIISNASENAVDNLAAEYAYVMHSRTFVKTWHETQPTHLMGTLNATSRFVQTSKERSVASPFGFGLLPLNLSGKRAMILSALGISRRW